MAQLNKIQNMKKISLTDASKIVLKKGKVKAMKKWYIGYKTELQKECGKYALKEITDFEAKLGDLYPDLKGSISAISSRAETLRKKRVGTLEKSENDFKKAVWLLKAYTMGENIGPLNIKPLPDSVRQDWIDFHHKTHDTLGEKLKAREKNLKEKVEKEASQTLGNIPSKLREAKNEVVKEYMNFLRQNFLLEDGEKDDILRFFLKGKKHMNNPHVILRPDLFWDGYERMEELSERKYVSENLIFYLATDLLEKLMEQKFYDEYKRFYNDFHEAFIAKNSYLNSNLSSKQRQHLADEGLYDLTNAPQLQSISIDTGDEDNGLENVQKEVCALREEVHKLKNKIGNLQKPNKTLSHRGRTKVYWV